MTGWGERLRVRREELRISVLQAAEELKVRPEHIQALEAEDFSAFVAPVYARVFLKSYAKLVGLESQEMLAQLAEPAAAPPRGGRAPAIAKADGIAPSPGRPASQAVVRGRPMARPAPRPARGRKPIGPQPIDLESQGSQRTILLPAVLVLGVIAVSVFLSVQWDREPGRSGPPRAPASAAPAAAVGSPSVSLSKVGVAVAPPNTGTPDPTALVTVRVDAADLTWLEYSADDAPASGANLAPGQSQAFTARGRLVLRIGNAGGVKLVFNGRTLGVPGKANQVRHLIFERAGGEDHIFRITNGERRPWQPSSQ